MATELHPAGARQGWLQAATQSLAGAWTLAAVLGTGMGLAVVAANGAKWPGHRSFFFALGLSLGLPLWRSLGPSIGAGLIAGTMHALYRGSMFSKDSGPELAAMVATPALLGLIFALAAPVARTPRGGLHWWFAIAAGVFCLTSPALSHVVDSFSATDPWQALVHLGKAKPWITHPVMGAAGALVAQTVLWCMGGATQPTLQEPDRGAAPSA